MGATVQALSESKLADHTLKGSRSSWRGSRLTLVACFQVGGERFPLKVLVDTGSEHCLIRPEIVHSSCFNVAKRPIRFVAANNSAMEGGNLEVEGVLCFHGKESESKSFREFQFPVAFYLAGITVDAIISYRWLAEQGMVVNPRRHGLSFLGETGAGWLAGEGPNAKFPPAYLQNEVASSSSDECPPSSSTSQCCDVHGSVGGMVYPPTPKFFALWTCVLVREVWQKCSKNSAMG